MNFLYTTWEYIVVFLMAATPWVEIGVVIPVAIVAGLSAFWVTIIAFLGNALPVWLIILLYEKWEVWRAQRKKDRENIDQDPHEDPLQGPLQGPLQDQYTNSDNMEGSKRGKRARKIWDRYGLPGLALLAPAITGIHLAAVIALAFKSPQRATVIWMTISLALWSVGMGVISYYGIELLNN